jgi:NADP-dependent 3-hydroxy acid dehydrogenase YdfG
VVVAARRADALEDLARECRAAGGQALAVPTDVTDEAAVAELARRAMERFGRIDVWVNNAGVYLLGLLEATPPEAFRRVLHERQRHRSTAWAASDWHLGALPLSSTWSG